MLFSLQMTSKNSILPGMRKNFSNLALSPQYPPDETNSKTQSLIDAYCPATEAALEDCNQACGNFRNLVVEITEDSRDSYLTIEFDTKLRSFAQFLKAAADDGWLIASGKDIEGKLKIDSKYFEKRFLADTRH